MKNHYIKYPLDYKKLFRILSVLQKKRVNFFIDVQSIATGFYNKNNVFMELSHYVDNGKVSDTLIQELRAFLNMLYKSFRQYDPFFVLFYDDGYCEQNRAIYSEYKGDRAKISTVLMFDEQVELYRQIKQYYYKMMEERFTKKDISKVFYLRQYEADFIPHYCVMNSLFDSRDKDILNIILSNDKDLMQTCKFQNVIQCTVTYNLTKTPDQRTPCRIFDDQTAMSYIHKSIKKGSLSSEYIPMLLSITGDVSDHIPGIKNIGPVKARDQILNWNIPPTIEQLRPMLHQTSKIIQENFDLISRNFKLIDFEKQIERISSLSKTF
jgi:5'-3' exonuclease